MKKILFILLSLFSLNLAALSGEAYMTRFNAYRAWMENLPKTLSPEFIAFIQEDLPLSQKLREKWLYDRIKHQDFANYLTYYQPSKDLSLQCYQNLALYQTGKQALAFRSSLPLWLTGQSLPAVCNQLFENLFKLEAFDDKVMTERLILALNQRNLPLAFYLLKHYKSPHLQCIRELNVVNNNPININKLISSDLKDDFYLYGLKRLVSINMDKAIGFWRQARRLLSESQEQAFLAHIALYKAMRNHEDTLAWLSKVKPQFYNGVLVDWGIRFALKRQNWKEVIRLIQASTNKDSPCWQYWLARAFEAQGQGASAKLLYDALAKNRNYYGFLASLRLHQAPSFENEEPTTNLLRLKPYQSILNEIEGLYRAKKILEASRLLTDFLSELPKEDASTLIYWVAVKLHWYGKSVYLSSNEIFSNQLALRFPLAYNDSVRFYAKQYGIPPEFVYAIIRQESGFREDVTSSAGARGLMQIMPKTAFVVSKASKIAYKDQNQLFLFQKNINIGIAYLKELAKRFRHHPVLMAAAYNAGPKQVVYWLKTHPPKEIDVWIETLPWLETRNYLKNIMAFYVVYQYRLHQKPDLNAFMTPL